MYLFFIPLNHIICCKDKAIYAYFKTKVVKTLFFYIYKLNYEEEKGDAE